MSSLQIPYRDIALENFTYYALSQQMGTLPWQPIASVNWEGFSYKPNVNFQMAHDSQRIFIHYSVQEEFVKAQYVHINEAVWEDSCVEFFVSFDKKVSYYNIEFNVLGTGLIGSGSRRKEERARLDPAITTKVRTATTVVNVDGKKKWNIILVIPTAVFVNDKIGSLRGLTAHANFYKCGDGLPTPHFLSWSKIEHPTPNFHLPDFFGEIVFE
ncbi:carbohydrate-binding family 9-like protein [Sphingobacterium gobiense]|uniref:Carbohydrate-binding domain-containing protein n=1 Tax=Sphingobacterium gobiense TaxID=1382456 RepID=A0A2S9JRA4_9SPHI|nr:carbohydrate-binding family 9-like protein [Sphingobacterium gobiense]PRD55826.1 hypothetical protein C5749_00590 [Sphingobacterium gobiense]